MKRLQTLLAITIALLACSAPAAVSNSNATDSGTVPNSQGQANKDGVVEVTVLAKENQKIIPNANVIIYREGNQTSGITGSNGVVLLRVPPGQFTVIVTKGGRGQAQLASTMVAGQTNRVRIELDPALKITGTVRDPSGAAVAGALVAVFPNYNGGNNEAKTDASGHYEVAWQRPAWQGMENLKFFLIARSLERNLAVIHEVDEKTTNLDLSLKPGLTVSGRVEDPKSNPVTNALGYLMFFTENSSFTINNNRSIQTDEHGRFEIVALPAGERFGVMIMAKGYGSASRQMETTDTKTNRYEFPAIVLKIADRKLAGRVLDTDGKPVAGAQINISLAWGNGNSSGQPQLNTRSETDGHFAFDAVCEGPVSLSAYLQGRSGNMTASGGDTNVIIRLGANNIVSPASPASVTIAGTVTGPSGAPASGVTMMVSPASGIVRDVTTDADGKYSLGWEPRQLGSNSKFFLIARDTDHNLAVAQEITATQTNADLRLESAFSLSGTVLDENDSPINRASVNLNFMAGNTGGMVERRPVQTDTKGKFTIASLPTGQRYNVYIRADGYGSTSKSVSQTETQNGNLELPPFKLKLASLQLSGQVLGSDNNPAAGAMVMLNGQGQPNSNTRADSTGHFSFKVCEGPLTVLAFSPQGGTARATVQTRGGDTNVVLKMDVQQAQNALVRSTSVRSTPFRPRTAPLKEQPWTLRTIMHWPATHKTATTVLLCIQGAILAGIAGGIYWFVRKNRP